MAKRFKQSAIDAVPLLTENTERMSAADTGAGEESGGKKRFKTSALEAIQPKE